MAERHALEILSDANSLANAFNFPRAAGCAHKRLTARKARSKLCSIPFSPKRSADQVLSCTSSPDDALHADLWRGRESSATARPRNPDRSGQEGYSRCHEKNANDALDRDEIRPEPLDNADKGFNRQRRQQKRQAKPGRIGGEQRNIPLPIVSSDAATARMAARIGPMQGVQPKPNASPMM